MINKILRKFKKSFIPTPKKQKSLVRGFTIIEIVTAIGVFGIGVLGLAGFFAASTQIVRSASNMSVATNLTSGFSDEEFAKSYDELIPGIGNRTPVSADPASPFFQYQYQIDISLIDDNLAVSDNDIGLKKIDVKVFWQEGTSEKHVQISTIKSRR